MRILYLHQYFVTPEMSGGTRSYEMARRLVAAGHEVHVITSDQRAGQTGGRGRWRVEDIDGITVHWYPVAYSNRMSFARRLWSFFHFLLAASVRTRKVRCDVVFATSTPLTIAIPGAFARWRHRVPMVFEVRDLWPEVPIAMGALRNPALRRVARWLESFAYRNADRVVALSPGMAEGIVRAGYPPSDVYVIPNSCDDAFAVPPSHGDPFRSARPWLGGRPLIIYPGTLGRVNGVDYLVRVAAEMKVLGSSACILILGDGSERDAVEREAQRLGVLGQNFYMEPPQPKRDMPSVFSAATLCVSVVIPLPALEMNSANKFFDALAAGRPIAVNHGGWQADIIEAEEVGLVLSATDAASAASALDDFISSPQRLQMAGTAALKLATDRFSRNNLAADLESVLVGAIHRNKF